MNRKFLKIIAAGILLLFPLSSFADQVYFYHTDPAGSPLAITNASGTTVWKADYKPFGEENSVTASLQNDRMFVGKEKDEESGLYYFGARYMEAKIGRFTAVDSVGAIDAYKNKTNENLLLDPQALNRYAYSLNNPYKYVDPDGRAWALIGPVLILYGVMQLGEFLQPRTLEMPSNSFIEQNAFDILLLPVGMEKQTASAISTTSKLLWGAWNDYKIVQFAGKEYAQIGERLYTRHAVERMMPSGLEGLGRSMSPNLVEDVIRNGTMTTEVMKNGIERQIFRSGSAEVVTEQSAKIVVTVNPFKY